MPSIVRDFSGKLNLDQHPSRIPPGDYVDAMAVTRDAQANGNDLVVSNIVGNRKVNYSLYRAGTTNHCIGAYADAIRNNVIYFVWNSDGYHSILQYNNSDRTITKILVSKTDSNGIDVLNFQLLYKVTSINVIHRDEDGDLLLFNDAYNRPRQLNIADFIAGLYDGLVTEELISLAKVPGLDELDCFYIDIPTQPVNALKKKLFQFCFAWGYKSGEISTISPVSKVAIPVDAYSIETESDPGKNNGINIQLIAGGLDYSFIRLFGRESIGEGWGNWFVIDTLKRDDDNIPPGYNYLYTFLNDGQYVTADQNYMDLLFDYVADQCNAQTLVNGNVVVQGGITDGYNPIKRSDINVQITSELKDTEDNSVTPANPSITYAQYQVIESSLTYEITDFYIGSSVSAGCFFSIKFHMPISGGSDYNPYAEYTAVSGDTWSNVAAALAPILNSQVNPNPFRSVTFQGVNVVRVKKLAPYNLSDIVTTAIAPVIFTGGNPTWKWAAKYRLGLVYVDKYGKTNGVVSFVTSDSDTTDFALTTATFDFNNTVGSPYYGNPKIPVIKASINHIPPSWAVAYYWVRTPNQTTNSFLQYITSETRKDTNYIYYCIENLEVFKEDNTGFVPSYTFKSGDRVRLYAGVNFSSAPYYVINPNSDYEILGTVELDMSITSGTPTKGLFLKVKRPPGSVPYDGYDAVMIEIYTPSVRSDNDKTVFYAFGESYPIYTDTTTGIRYHVGQVQNQTATQPATFVFQDGDVYYKFRDFYKLNRTTGKIDPTTVYSRGIMDANYSDYWSSAVNSNSTAWVIDPNAKRLFQPTLIRFGQAYQPGTDINGLNRFYPGDFDEYFRDYGAIMRFSIRDKLLHVYQKLRMGRVPIYGQIVKDQSGNEQVFISDKLLNPIQYYTGQFGMGDHPEILGSNNYTDYFGSNIRTTINRLGQNGLEPISIVHEINNFCVTELGQRDFNYKCYGVFDTYNNLYILALEETPTSAAKTLVWNEQRNGFESFLPYHPEMMACLNQLLITWKDGQLYTHDSDTYNNFYGVQYDSWITPVFNDNRLQKKTWENVTELASDIWECPEITTQLNSFPNNNTKQTSLLKKAEFAYLEGEYNAVFRGDASIDINNNTVLKGTYMIAKFKSTQSDRLTYLDTVQVEYKESHKNISK